MSAARFWLRDIWGPGWDAERRALLAQHYWSYARYAAVPPVHLPERDRLFDGEVERFADAYLARIAAIQSHAATRRRVRLTYRPLGKNLRLLATAIRRNADRNMATDIDPDPPAHEQHALERRGHAWHPWLWARDGASTDVITADRAWRRLFSSPGDFEHPAPIPAPPPGLSRGQHGLTAAQLERIVKLAVATGHASAPIDAIASDVREQAVAIGWPSDGTPVIGLHVRRSDAASTDDGTPRLSNRRSFAIDRYLEQVDRLCDSYGIRHVFMATESAVELERARRLRPRYTFMTVAHDRALFPDIERKSQYIEELVLGEPQRALPLARSAIVDLQLFRRCAAFVGAFNSEFSVLAWLLCIAGQRRMVPFISLSEPDRKWRLHPYDALLNLRNNCPLELYHW